MQDFIYHKPVKILFGHDQIPALAQEVPQDKKVIFSWGSLLCLPTSDRFWRMSRKLILMK
ncbi:hypothetical protein F0319_10980 [Enterobacter vonholyi]|nr:hypothetical protein F0319_10980 [Enterobacter vonholyi]